MPPYETLSSLAAEYRSRKCGGIATLLELVDASLQDIVVVFYFQSDTAVLKSVRITEHFSFFSEFLRQLDAAGTHGRATLCAVDETCWEVVASLTEPSLRTVQ